MARYDYLVTGVDPEMVLEGEAASDAEAWRAAVILVSEIMREPPVLRGGPFALHVVVTAEGRKVCSVETRSYS